MSAAAFGLACLGFMLLSFSLRKHNRAVWPESTDYSQWVLCNRTVGYVLLFLALVPCVLAYELWIGLVLWMSILALAAFLQIFLLTSGPARAALYSGARLVLIVVGLLL